VDLLAHPVLYMMDCLLWNIMRRNTDGPRYVTDGTASPCDVSGPPALYIVTSLNYLHCKVSEFHRHRRTDAECDRRTDRQTDRQTVRYYIKLQWLYWSPVVLLWTSRPTDRPCNNYALSSVEENHK